METGFCSLKAEFVRHEQNHKYIESNAIMQPALQRDVHTDKTCHTC